MAVVAWIPEAGTIDRMLAHRRRCTGRHGRPIDMRRERIGKLGGCASDEANSNAYAYRMSRAATQRRRTWFPMGEHLPSGRSAPRGLVRDVTPGRPDARTRGCESATGNSSPGSSILGVETRT